jgi:hypothetical protein
MSNFSVPGENRGGKSRHLNGGASLLVSQAPIEPDDLWSREQLIRMDSDFVAAVERAIAQGLEQRRSAGNQYRPRRGPTTPAWNNFFAVIFPKGCAGRFSLSRSF